MTKTLTAAEKSRLRLTEATETLKARQMNLAGAQVRLETVIAARQAGDESLAVTAKRDALDEIEHWEALVAAAERAIKAAERAQRAVTPNLAITVAAALGTGLYGVTATAANESQELESTKSPQVTVVQMRPEELDVYRGTMRGSVTIVCSGPDYMAAPDLATIKRLLRSDDIRLGLDPSILAVKPGVFQVELQIALAWAQVPVLMEDRITGDDLGSIMAKRLMEQNWLHSERDYALTVTGESNLVSIENSPERKATVALTLSTRPRPHGLLNMTECANVVQRYVERFSGTAIADLGRCENVEVIGTERVATQFGGNLVAVKARLTFASQAPA